jgi:hypothetical protein
VRLFSFELIMIALVAAVARDDQQRSPQTVAERHGARTIDPALLRK